MGQLERSVAELRSASFEELGAGYGGAIQLMNFSQTKGREADAVILSHTSDDFWGPGGEPYDEPSRLLYVTSLEPGTRSWCCYLGALNPLVAPFAQYP